MVHKFHEKRITYLDDLPVYGAGRLSEEMVANEEIIPVQFLEYGHGRLSRVP
jgi:hypothetical protein